MMKSPRLYVLSSGETPTIILDNDAPGSLHYFDDSLHTYLSVGGAGTFTFTVDSTHEDCGKLQPGMKIAFRYDDRDWYFSIITVERDESETVVGTESLSFELLGEEVDKFEAKSELTLNQYFYDMGFEKELIYCTTNEVSAQRKKLKFDQRETVLKRLSRIADAFNAEISLDPVLSGTGSLTQIRMGIYAKGTKRGMGHDRTAQIVRWGNGPESIRKKQDLSDFCSSVRALGKTTKETTRKVTKRKKRWVRKSDGATVKSEETQTTVTELEAGTQTIETVLTVSGTYRKKTQKTELKKKDGTVEKKTEDIEFNSNGKEVKFKDTEVTVVTDPEEKDETTVQETVKLTGCQKTVTENGREFLVIGDDLRCPSARDRYPSVLAKNAEGGYLDGYVVKYFENTECETQDDLFNAALEELKKHIDPKVSYEITGVTAGDIGDWITVEDAGFAPIEYYQCRIVEREIRISTGEVLTVKLDNFTEMHSKLSASLTSQIRDELDRITTYDCRITSAQSVVMDDDGVPHVFSAVVRKGAVDVTDQTMISWTLGGAAVPENDSRITTPGQITLYPEDISAGATELKFTATQNGIYRGEGAVTLSASPYICRISAPQGTIMDDDSPHTFTASVQKGSVNVTPTMTFTWTLDGTLIGSGTQVGISPENVPCGSSALSVAAKSKNSVRASAGLTLSRTVLIVTDGENGATITINEHSAFITKGEPGEDGVSPVVSLSKSGKTSTLKVTDKNGVHTTQILDGTDGTNGANGTNGKDAPTITSITGYYYRSTSQTSVPVDSLFSTSRPTLTSTYKYLWMYERYMMSDGTYHNGPKHVAGVYGDTGSGTAGPAGADGADGVGISSITVKYYQSSSSSAPSQSSSSWSTTLPAPTAGYYLHTQIAITLTSGATTYFYLKSRNGTNGSTPTVVNNLTSTSTTSALSAAQGKALKALIDAQDTKISNLPVGKYEYEHTDSNFVSISEFMTDISTLSKSVIPFKVKASASWAPAGVGAWLKGIIFVQNAGLSSDFGTVLATTASGAYHGHISYSSSTAAWNIAWKAL